MAHYVDTSAAVKLVVKEPETAALRRWVDSQEGALTSSDLMRTELLRAVRRIAPNRVVRARSVLESLDLLTLSASVFDRAGAVRPDSLRSLDALHIAAALELGDDLESLVTYDERLAEAATANGVRVVAPGS